MDVRRPEKKINIVIVASPDGTPVEQQSGKRLPAPQADIVGGVEDPVVIKEEKIEQPVVVKEEKIEMPILIQKCSSCGSIDITIAEDHILCNVCEKIELK